MTEQDTNKSDELQQLANQQRTTLVGEFVLFLRQNKKWWLLPIILILLALGLLVIFGSSAIAPFIYPLL